MVERLSPYPAYKPSGVEELGDVPAHWEVRQLGRLGRFFKGNGGSKADETVVGIPCVRYGDLYTKHQFHIWESRGRVDPEVAASAYTTIKYGDALFAGSGETIDEIGKSAVNLMRGPACCGGDVIIFRPNIAMDASFLGYASDCQATARQKARNGRGFTVFHIYAADLKYVSIAVPPLSEQAATAHFLNHATSRIDRYIRAKQRLLGSTQSSVRGGSGLLGEYRDRLISDIVTGKLDVREATAALQVEDDNASAEGGSK